MAVREFLTGAVSSADYASNLPVLAHYATSALSAVFALSVGVAILILVWWLHGRNLRIQKRALRTLVELAEDVLSAESVRDLAERVRRGIPSVVPGWQGEIYLLNEEKQLLQTVEGQEGPTSSIPVDCSESTLQGAVAVSFRNRSLIDIDNTRNSPILERDLPSLPAAAIIVPMFAQSVSGVLVVQQKRRRENWTEVKMALQHLANQVAISMQLQEQQTMREQLGRSEKLAAAGQLIAAIAKEVQAPLEAIREVALRTGNSGSADEALSKIRAETHRGLEIINHLISLARTEQRHSAPLDLHDLISCLLEMRAPDRARRGVELENRLPVSPEMVFGERGQLEHAMLTVLVHIEQCAIAAAERKFSVSSRRDDETVIIYFASAAPARSATDTHSTSGDYFGLPVAQVIVQNHGGELRFLPPSPSGARFEIELPAIGDGDAAPETIHTRPARVLTCLLVEPDPSSQRRLLAMLSARGHRAIPVNTPEEGADLAQKLHFAAVFCSSRLPGLQWTEFYNRVRRRGAAFALLAGAYESIPPNALKEDEGQVLPTPITDSGLDVFLALAERRADRVRT
ncbi:MAG TPA: hypothetical protein VES20_21545 [Bryobacteraceae bacterium]|nr:hypothetical protein [Bryobacteraceae bacterium]